MDRHFLFWMVFMLLASTALAAPIVLNVCANQRADGSELVDVDYDLSGGQGAMTVSNVFFSDNGVTWSAIPRAEFLSGSFGQGITNGTNRHIVGDAGKDMPGVRWTQCSAKVTASDSSGPQELTITLPGGVPLVMVRIPAGSFMMGSNDPGWSDSDEQPVHEVTISSDFYMGKYEVTQAQWQAVMGINPSVFTGDSSSPVSWASWKNANGFIERLNALGKGTFRLPSEAEWEYACRAGTTTRFYFGDSNCSPLSLTPCDLDSYAWWWGNSGGTTHPVGQKLPNAFGLYDMHGNVWEWCQDWYGLYPSGAVTDPVGPSSGSFRVLRGGGWKDFARRCHSAYRYRLDPGSFLIGSGFRLAMTP